MLSQAAITTALSLTLLIAAIISICIFLSNNLVKLRGLSNGGLVSIVTLSIYPFCSIAAILSFIEQHYPENTTLSNIAEIVNISERETLRCFKKITGESTIQYLLKYRLIRSASVLTEYPDKNISIVAEECGFDSPAYYTKKCAYRLHAAERKIDVKVRNIGQQKCYNDLRNRSQKTQEVIDMAHAEKITFQEFRTRFSTEESCRAELFRLRFPNGFVCPKCGCTEYYPVRGRNAFQCRACRHQTSVTAGTVMHRTHLPLTA